MSYQLRPSQPSQPSQQEDGGHDAYTTYEYGPGYGQQAYAQPQQPDMQPPPLSEATMYYHDGLARTHTWIANQPPVMTPPPTTKTPFSEWTGPTTDSTFDRRTLGGYSATMPPRPPNEDVRVCGVKRNAFFIILAIGLFLVVVAIAVGLGVGLGTRKSSSSVALDSTPADLGCVAFSLSRRQIYCLGLMPF